MVKRMMIKIILIFVGFFSVSNSQNHFMPNLPFGEYRVVTEKIYPCESTRNHLIKFNLYFSKKTSNITELKGNFTYLIPLDDTLIFDINLASWDSTGGWIPNAYIIMVKKPCSTLKNIMGKAWLKLLKAFNMPSTCPIPVIDLNLESWGSTGGWIPNSNVYVTKKTCSTIKKLGGNAWYTIMKGFNFPNTTCPISVDECITSGLDLKKFEDNSFPKIYFYGKYKLVFKVKTTENKIVACVYLEINLLQPWETKI